MQKKVMVTATMLALSALFVVAAAHAADQKAAAPSATSVNVQGVQVAIDPATGRLVAPSAAQRAALSRAMVENAASGAARPRSALGHAIPRNEAEARATFRTIRLKNGHSAVGMDVPENLMSSLVAERHADGSLSIHHAGDETQTKTVEVTK